MKISPTLLVRLTNFGLFASTACILPFLSIHFLSHTNATYEDFGRLNLVASILSSLIGFLFMSLTDCRKARRPIYLMSLLVALVSFILLACPLVLDRIGIKPDAIHITHENETLQVGILKPEIDSRKLSIDDCKNTLEEKCMRIPTQNYSSNISPGTVSVEPHNLDGYGGVGEWSYFIYSCILVGSTALMNSLSSSIMINIDVSMIWDESCNSFRIWSCLGWIMSSMLLFFIDRLSIMALLLSSLIMYIILSTLNLFMTSLLWSEDRFVIASLARSGHGGPKGARFKFNTNFWSKGGTLIDCERDLSITTRENYHNCGDIVVTKFSKNSLFDSRDEDIYRNIRRCSLAPLGDSFVIKQFELDNNGGKHFCHVTKIEPCGGNNSDVPTIEYNIQNCHQLPGFCSQCAVSKKFGLLLSLKLIGMLLSRNKLVMLKFLFLIATNGFLVALNWFYLFPYLLWLGAARFGSLASSVNMAAGFGELIFCLIRPQIMKSTSHSTSLSLILILYGLRYSLYLVFTIAYQSIPLEMIILVELLYSAARSWFFGVNVSLVMELGHLVSNYVPELIELDWIDNTKEAINRFNEGARGVLFNLSAFCFNGIGLALGSLIGGWLIDNYGFTTLWVVGASTAYLTGMINILLDLKIYYNNKCDHPHPSVNEGR